MPISIFYSVIRYCISLVDCYGSIGNKIHSKCFAKSAFKFSYLDMLLFCNITLIIYFTGTICVLLGFPFIFSQCIGCESAHQYAQLIYYAAFVVIFQFGWAAVQISHLALVPELTPAEHERTELIAIR